MDGTANSLRDPARSDHFIRKNGEVYAGTHLIIDVVDGIGLNEETRIRDAFTQSIAAAGATLIHLHTHRFSPQGISGVAILAESHMSAHTWPEIGYGAFDVFMCGATTPWAIPPILARIFETTQVITRELHRGKGLDIAT